MEYKIKSMEKTQVTKYQLRYEGGPWADIFLEDWDVGKSGKVLISSDWGSWESSWGSMGGTIREFLLRIDKGYTMKNLAHGGVNGYQKYFDEDATEKEVKRAIIATRLPDSRRASEYKYCWPDWTKEEARDAWYDLEDFFGNGFTTAEGYGNALLGCDGKWVELWHDFDWPCVTGYHPRFLNFMDNIWPEFLDVLRKEKAPS